MTRALSRLGTAAILAAVVAASAPPAAAERQVTEVFKAGGGGENLFHPFTNPAAITLNDNAPATPYPSTIEVAGRWARSTRRWCSSTISLTPSPPTST